YADDPLKVFPFVHTAIWADADRRILSEFLEEFKGIAKQVMQSNLAAIRNGLDHKRDESRFPTVDAMLAFVARFVEALDSSDVKRYLPKSFWLDRRVEDRFGQAEYTFRDYCDRPLLLHGPPFVSGSRGIAFNMPYLIAPKDLLGYPNSTLLFEVKE